MKVFVYFCQNLIYNYNIKLKNGYIQYLEENEEQYVPEF